MPEITDSKSRIEVYTDGACIKNPGPGGWAWFVPKTQEQDSGGEAGTTNNRMELTAVLNALKALSGDLLIFSDSKYIVQCFEDKWWEKWIKKNWKTSQGKPVQNLDLFKPLIDEVLTRGVQLKWVQAHIGVPGNEMADKLAYQAAQNFIGQEPPQGRLLDL